VRNPFNRAYETEGIVKSLGDPKIKELILDVLKPHTHSLPAFATFLAELPGVERVEVILVEKDERTESLEVILQGHDISYDVLKEHMEKHRAVIHSIDKVLVISEE
jgi:hypothetical protein